MNVGLCECFLCFYGVDHDITIANDVPRIRVRRPYIEVYRDDADTALLISGLGRVITLNTPLKGTRNQLVTNGLDDYEVESGVLLNLNLYAMIHEYFNCILTSSYPLYDTVFTRLVTNVRGVDGGEAFSLFDDYRFCASAS